MPRRVMYWSDSPWSASGWMCGKTRDVDYSESLLQIYRHPEFDVIKHLPLMEGNLYRTGEFSDRHSTAKFMALTTRRFGDAVLFYGISNDHENILSRFEEFTEFLDLADFSASERYFDFMDQFSNRVGVKYL